MTELEIMSVRVGDLENQVSDMKNQRDSDSILFRLNFFTTEIEDLKKAINDLQVKVKALSNPVK